MAPPTRRGRETEEAFVRAARAVIAEKGFLRTTVADIAAEAQRSSASFYNYFETKEALLARLADEFRDENLARAKMRLRKDAPPRRIVRDMVTVYWTTYRERLPELVGVFQVAMVDDDFAARWRDTRQAGLDGIERSIRQAQRKGYCPNLHAKTAASALAAMLEHFCYVALAAPGNAGDKPIDDDTAIDTLSELWYRSIYWKGRSRT